MINTYYGSCTGCDCWEDAKDKYFRTLCINIANNARMFDTIEDAILDLKRMCQSKDATDFDWGEAAPELLEQLEQYNIL